jgi:hypothetical protein
MNDDERPGPWARPKAPIFEVPSFSQMEFVLMVGNDNPAVPHRYVL